MSTIRQYSDGINVNFPAIGGNNSSKGFWDNFQATRQGLDAAHQELTQVQETRIQLMGDLQGTTGRLGAAVKVGNADPVLQATIELANVLPLTDGTVDLDTTSGDFRIKLDRKGRVISQAAVTRPINWSAGHGANQILGVQGANLGTGSGSIGLPLLAFDAQGRLTGTAITRVDFGLEGHVAPRGAVVVGGGGDRSVLLAKPQGSGVYSLIADDQGVSWRVAGQGMVSSVVGGGAMRVDGASGAPTVHLDLRNTTIASSPQVQDLLVFQRAAEPRAIRFQDLQLSMVKLAVDTQPSLGGDLDAGAWRLFSTNSQGLLMASAKANSRARIRIQESQLSIATTTGTPLSIQGALWPTTSPQVGQFLTMGAGGQMLWSSSLGGLASREVHVSPLGDDASPGSQERPVRTLARALALVPQNNPGLWTIVLQGGEWDEDVSVVNRWHLALENSRETSNAVVRGALTLGSGCRTFRMAGVSWDLRARSLLDTRPTMMVASGLESGVIRDCRFLRGELAADHASVQILGELPGELVMRDCWFQGRVENASVGVGRLVIQDAQTTSRARMTLLTQSGSRTSVLRSSRMGPIRHDGGELLVQDVLELESGRHVVATPQSPLPLWEEDAQGDPQPVFIQDPQADPADTQNPSGYLRNRDAQGDPQDTWLLDDQGQRIPDDQNPGDYLTTPWVQEMVGRPDIVERPLASLLSGAMVGHLDLRSTRLMGPLAKRGQCSWSLEAVQGELGEPQGPGRRTLAPGIWSLAGGATLEDRWLNCRLRIASGVPATLHIPLTAQLGAQLGDWVDVSAQGAAVTLERQPGVVLLSPRSLVLDPRGTARITLVGENTWDVQGDLQAGTTNPPLTLDGSLNTADRDDLTFDDC